jgi:hypothetical protein
MMVFILVTMELMSRLDKDGDGALI